MAVILGLDETWHFCRPGDLRGLEPANGFDCRFEYRCMRNAMSCLDYLFKQRKTNSSTLSIYRFDLHINNITHRNHVMRILNPASSLTHLRNMKQAVLLDTQVYKSPEINHVTNCPLKLHSGREILHLQYILAEQRFGQ